MASFTLKLIIHPAQKAHIAWLLVKKVTVLEEYPDFANVFLKKLAEILPKRMEINKYAIELQEGK